MCISKSSTEIYRSKNKHILVTDQILITYARDAAPPVREPGKLREVAMTQPHPLTPDVLVIGAALNGLAAALALGGRRVKRPLNVVLIDAKDPCSFASSGFDGRASAITASARRMFEALGIWEKVAHEAQAMQEIIVTDSLSPGDARPVLLHFGTDDMGGRPSAHMIENRHLYGAMLEEALASQHITLAVGQAVQGFSFGPAPKKIGLE